ncbi:MAG: T9SS type A sorting domain-containing protein [Bacteroidota bacterium]
MRVYDLLGREIATLINEEVMAGRLYQATFDARSISTGLYFYRIEFDGNALVRKMSLVK